MYLSDDLMLEIFTRLPLKPLLRCKSISKAGHQLISQHCLERRKPVIISGVLDLRGGSHLRHVSTVTDGCLDFTDLNFFPFRRNSTLVDSCNGLLLFLSPLRATLFVVNPINKKWVQLPDTCRSPARLSIMLFDPSTSSCYKVVNLLEWQARGIDLEVFSSETGEWKVHHLQLGINSDTISTTMTYSNGHLHILAPPLHVISIDLDTFTSRTIELPEPAKREGHLRASRDRLYYLNGGDVGGKFRSWMLQDGRWGLKHEIGIPESIRVMGFDPEAEVVYGWTDGKLTGFRIGDGGLDLVCGVGKEMEGGDLIKICVFPFSGFISDCLNS